MHLRTGRAAHAGRSRPRLGAPIAFAMALAVAGCGDDPDAPGGTAGSSTTTTTGTGSGTGTTTGTATGGTGGTGGTTGGGGGDVGYPGPPYGNQVGDIMAPLEWEGYVNLDADSVATTQPYVDWSTEDVRTSGTSHALVHLAAVF